MKLHMEVVELCAHLYVSCPSKWWQLAVYKNDCVIVELDTLPHGTEYADMSQK